MIDKDWNPGYIDIKKGFIAYEKAWYCNTNKLIHKSEKDYLNCVHCKKMFVENLIIKK